jgi:integrase
MGLTDLSVRRFVPRSTRFEVSDGKGLSIRITPNGAKTWVFRYQFKGIPRRMSFGNYPGVSLAKARELHAQALQELQGGTDPGLKAQREKSKIKAEPNFKELLAEFWDLELSKQPSGKDRRRLVEKDVLRAWGKRKVSSITRRDAVLLLDTVRNRAPVTANRLQGVVVRMFNFACERGIIDHSPLVGMKRGKEEARARILNDDEIKALWQALDLDRKDIDIYKPTKLALKMILLTGQRPGEVSGMKWEEIKEDWWIIPATRTKTRKEHRVPILPMVAGILEDARVYSGESPFVFASSYN